jgi:hypothetical protein
VSEALHTHTHTHTGTQCDVTGEPRTLQVHFKCATDSLNVIASVKEKSTCKYILVFYTPLICNHPQVSQCTCFTGISDLRILVSQCTCFTVFYTPLICNHPQVSQCTCFTGTKVQMRALDIEEYEDTYNARTIAGVFFIALLVQKYK